jgi:hypothetical protein
MNASAQRMILSGSPLRVLLGLACGIGLFAPTSTVLAQAQTPSAGPRLTLADCIALGMRNQPGIQAQEAGVAMAQEVKNVAKSYYFPQVEMNTALTQLNQHLYFRVPNPISGQLADVLSDAAAFFGIARQAGTAAALQALNYPALAPLERCASRPTETLRHLGNALAAPLRLRVERRDTLASLHHHGQH